MNVKELYYSLAKYAKENKLIYNIVHYFRSLRSKMLFNKSLSNFHKYGYDTMKLFDQCMVSNGHPYSVAFGTLLGTIRNSDFIPHDDDIDVAMWIEDYTDSIITDLEKVGIHLYHSYSIEEDKVGKELTFEHKNVLIDIFFFYRDSCGNAYCCDFVNQPGCSTVKESIYRKGGLLPRKLVLPLNTSLKRMQLRDIYVNVPSNYVEILSYRYGPDYMIPKKGWRPKTSSIIEMHQYLGIIK